MRQMFFLIGSGFSFFRFVRLLALLQIRNAVANWQRHTPNCGIWVCGKNLFSSRDSVARKRGLNWKLVRIFLPFMKSKVKGMFFKILLLQYLTILGSFSLISLSWFVRMITTVKPELMSSDCNAACSPFGNTRIRNVLKDFYFEGNISDVDDVTKVFARIYCLFLEYL